MNFPSLTQSNIHKSSLKAFITRVADCFENTIMMYDAKRWKEFYKIFLKDKNFRSHKELNNNVEFIRYIMCVLKDAIKDYKYGFDIGNNDSLPYDAIRENNNMILTFLRPLHFEDYLNRQRRRYKINPNFMEQLMTFYETHYGATFIKRYGGYEHNMNKLYVLTLEQIIKEGIREVESDRFTGIDYDVEYIYNRLRYIAFSYCARVLEKNLPEPILIDKDEKLHEKSNEECIICLDKKIIRILCNTCNECKLCFMCAEKIKEKCPCCRTNNFKKIE
jgi:hypothetical protein